MAGTITLRHLAVAIAGISRALALPQPQQDSEDDIGQQGPPLAWITLDPKGSAHTIHPAVTSIDGTRTTLSVAPTSLIESSTYIIAPNGHTTTTTGRAPVALATVVPNDHGVFKDTGAFLSCAEHIGPIEPFCQPKNGAVLAPGNQYFVTWSPAYYEPGSSVWFNALYEDGNRWNYGPMPASKGFYIWNVPGNFLDRLDNSETPDEYNVTLILSHENLATVDDPHDQIELHGPQIFISNKREAFGAPNGGGGGPGSGWPNILTIVLPVVLVAVIVLLLGGFCFWSWRKRGTVPIVGAAMMKRRSSGYGERQSRSQRVSGSGGGFAGSGGFGVGAAAGAGRGGRDVKGEDSIGVELTDRDSWSPTSPTSAKLGSGGPGRNVFREELQRQERER